MINQPLPYNLDIEKSVLGCLLIDKAEYVVKLTEKDFSSQTHKLIYKAINFLNEKKQQIDVITVSDLLKKKMDNALGVVTRTTNYVVTPENAEHYIKTLKTYTMRREIIRGAMQAIDMAYNAEYQDGLELKSDVLQKLDVQVYEGKKKDNTLESIMTEIYADIERKYNEKEEEKLFAGFRDLDKVTAGFHPEELTIIAARPGVGKTAFAIQLIINLAKKGNCCLLVSREMSALQIGKRILANVAKIDGHKLRFCKSLKDKDWQDIGQVHNMIAKLPVEINDHIATIQEIRAYCRELKTKGKLDALFVDYLQLCRVMGKAESKRHEIEDISRHLKEMSLEFGIPVIALSQLSRDSAKSGREPAMHDLRESGALEQDADNILFLHVPQSELEDAGWFDIKVIIEKQRNGPTGYIKLRYYRKIFRFESLVWG